jgi:hypothetical protein
MWTYGTLERHNNIDIEIIPTFFSQSSDDDDKIAVDETCH